MPNVIGSLRTGCHPDQHLHNGVAVYCAKKNNQREWQYVYNQSDMKKVTLIDIRKPIFIVDQCKLPLPGYARQNEAQGQKMSYYVALYENSIILLPELWATEMYEEMVK